MLISELIEKLEAVKTEHGDAEVRTEAGVEIDKVEWVDGHEISGESRDVCHIVLK